MTPYTSDTSERYSIWQAHGNRCFWCREIVAFANVHIDHLIPRAAADQLGDLIQEYSLPADLQIEDFRNIAPACARCNSDKADLVFKSSPKLLVQFHRVANLEPRVLKILNEIRKGQLKAKLIVLLHEEAKKGKLVHEIWTELNTLSYKGQTLEQSLAEEFDFANYLDEEQATAAVARLFEVQEFAKLLERTEGAGPLQFMTEIAGDSWSVRVFESKETHTATFGWYEVGPDGRVQKLMMA